MVNILAAPVASHPSDAILQWVKQGQLCNDEAEGSVSTDSGQNQLPMDPSTCIFWSAVGLGALVKGNPVQLVRALMILQYIYKCAVETLLICRL